MKDLNYRQRNSKNNLFNTKYFNSVVVVSLCISAIRDFFYFIFLLNKLRNYPICLLSSLREYVSLMQRQMPTVRSVFTHFL